MLKANSRVTKENTDDKEIKSLPLKYLFGEQKYSRKLWVLSLLIYMIKSSPVVHESEQLKVGNKAPHAFWWEAV